MVINITGHDADSLKAAAKKVLDYRDDVIEKNKSFVKKLFVVGAEEAVRHASEVAYDYEPPRVQSESPQVETGKSQADASIILSMVGDQVAFVEFGAGVHYNGNPGGSPHEWGEEFGFTIGSYGMHQGLEDGWWYFGHYFQGTPASAPLFHAAKEIENKAPSTAKDEFRS